MWGEGLARDDSRTAGYGGRGDERAYHRAGGSCACARTSDGGGIERRLSVGAASSAGAMTSEAMSDDSSIEHDIQYGDER